jgi:carboxylate-amine ligase
MFPRCGIPDPYDGWAGFEDYVRFLYDTGSITEHTQMWWSVRTHLAYPTVEIRICDAQPDPAEARSLAALIYALTVKLARLVDDGAPLELHPHRLLEENLWRAIRYGLSGSFIDLATGEVRPAREHLERLVEWVLPAAEEVGCASYLAIPAANAAERQIARFGGGATIEQIYAEQVRPKEAVA